MSGPRSAAEYWLPEKREPITAESSLQSRCRGPLERPGRHADDGLAVGDVVVPGHDGVGPDDGVLCRR